MNFSLEFAFLAWLVFAVLYGAFALTVYLRSGSQEHAIDSLERNKQRAAAIAAGVYEPAVERIRPHAQPSDEPGVSGHFAKPMSHRLANLQSTNDFYLSAMRGVFVAHGIKGDCTTAIMAARAAVYDVRLDKTTDLNQAVAIAEEIALAAGVRNVLVERFGSVVRYELELPEEHWRVVTSQDVKGAEIGLVHNKQKVSFSLDFNYHWGVFGSTGSGKSTAIRAILLALARTKKPSELSIFIVDPHQDYNDFNSTLLLGAPTATDELAIENTIRHVYEIFRERETAGNRKGQKIILVVDESQDEWVLGDAGSPNKKNLKRVTALAKGGGKFGIHLIIGSQRPSQANMPGIFDMLLERLVGRVDKAITSTSLTGQSNLDAHMLTGRGDFLYVSGHRVIRFQVATPTEEHVDSLPKRMVAQNIPRYVSEPDTDIPMLDPKSRPDEKTIDQEEPKSWSAELGVDQETDQLLKNALSSNSDATLRMKLAYEPGMTTRELAEAAGVSKTTATTFIRNYRDALNA